MKTPSSSQYAEEVVRKVTAGSQTAGYRVPRTLIGEGSAIVVGLPSGFALKEVLKKAEKVRLATAFAHRSGWKHFHQGIKEGTASVFLLILTGLECCQTEPLLLKDWLQLQSEQPKRIEAKLASPKTFFHPKVLLVGFANQLHDFAIVGSGNLSQGGIGGNTECSVYVQDGDLLKHLSSCCLLYTSPSPRDLSTSRMPSSA